MYIIDKLKMVNNTAQTDSIEFILSKYFLKNLLNLKKVSLKRISLETVKEQDLVALQYLLMSYHLRR